MGTVDPVGNVCSVDFGALLRRRQHGVNVYLADVAGAQVAVIDALTVGDGRDLASGKRIGGGGVVAGLSGQRGSRNDGLEAVRISCVCGTCEDQGSGENEKQQVVLAHQSTPAHMA